MEKLLEKLREFDALRDTSDDTYQDIVQLYDRDCFAPEYASSSVFDEFPADLKSALQTLGIQKLYKHQVEAIQSIRRNNDVIIVSPSASGKTLCFNIPIFLDLLVNPRSKALMLYPMKALENDQRRQLENLNHNIGNKILKSWIYDGDTPNDQRSLIRKKPPQILITNPEMLHQSFLGNCDKWEQFLKELRFLVIDEIHEYRGYFGTHMSFLIRRFLRKLHELGSNCQLILASATCANPKEHAYRLTGRKPDLIQNKRAIHPIQSFAFINPNLPPHQYYWSYIYRIVRAALACLSKNFSVVIFSPTRRFAEQAALKAQKEARDLGLEHERIAPYRAGFTAQDRRQIEEGLRSGKYQVVFSTNALELGIDIGRLDVCILAGFPDSMMSAWQRIGRAGRSWEKHAYIIFYALDNPIDQFYVSNLRAFLKKPLDELMIGLENEELAKKHISCLLYEKSVPIKDDDKVILGEYFWEKVREAQKDFKPVRYFRPHFNTPIRNTYSTNFKLVYNGHEIGTISGEQANREAYIGAIYNHFGKTYEVESYGANEIILKDANPNLRTEPLTYTTIAGVNIFDARRYYKVVEWFYGELTIYDNFKGYRVIEDGTGEVVDEHYQDNVTATKRSVQGCWLTISDSNWCGLDHIWERLAFVRYLLRTGTTFIIPCDRFDLGSYYNNNPPTAYIYETVPGGIGIIEKLFHIWLRALEQGIKITSKCPHKCKRGCPYCLHIERYDKNIPILSKSYGIELAKALLGITEDKSYEFFEPKLGSWKSK